MANCGNLPANLAGIERKNRAKAELSNKWFAAMATPEEKAILRPPPKQTGEIIVHESRLAAGPHA